MSYMGKTEVIILLPNSSWPCELQLKLRAYKGQFQRYIVKLLRINPNVGK